MSTSKIFGMVVALLTSLLLFQAAPGIGNELPVGELSAEMDATPSANNLVTNIVLSPHTPNILEHYQEVSFTFNYKTNEPGDVLIWGRPYTGSALTRNYAAHGSPYYSTGSGTGSGYFTITRGSVVVNRIRFEIWNATQTRRLFRGFIPVNYQFK